MLWNKNRSRLLLHLKICSIPGKSDDGDKMVPAIKKNFAELETGLVHLQQNIDIPEINLVIHPQILAVSFESGYYVAHLSDDLKISYHEIICGFSHYI